MQDSFCCTLRYFTGYLAMLGAIFGVIFVLNGCSLSKSSSATSTTTNAPAKK